MNKKFKSFSLLILTSVIGISGIFSHSVLAGDAKSISGRSCRDLSNQDDVLYADDGMLSRVSGRNWVVCPIVRDNMAAHTQHFTKSVAVRLSKRNATTTSCFLISRSLSGGTIRAVAGSTSQVGFPTIYLPSLRSYNSGLMNVACLLNYRDGIVAINYEER